ncbi:exocyst complex component EXO70H1-like [Cicer arietinum]|uniref:Exocyst subunit Exo70 family protein n=1 Tax=Cicer arietinum TaxID=3827 RepID=A0A1S2XXN2_CICAR|nr:exocyst complex component EXO70H1-like [Cicer arietinum]
MRIFCMNSKTPSFSTNENSSPSSNSTNSSTTPSNIKAIKRIDAAEAIIQKWNPETSLYAKITSLFYNNKNEAIEYVHCVNQLQRAMHSLLEYDPSSQKLIHAQNLMQIAMKRLQKEFYQILSMNRAHLDPESISVGSSRTTFCSDDGTPVDDVREAEDSISEVERVSSDSVADLKTIADCMVSNGYAKECVKVYITVRKSIVNEGIYGLGFEEQISFSKVNKMDWEVLEMKIKSWLEAVNISVRTLFVGERNLCHRIFASSSIREICFSEISRVGATLLFRFPELVTRTKKSPPEKIFSVLDMYVAITVLLPEIESIFSFNSTNAIKSQAYDSRYRLIQCVRNILSEFESAIVKDTSKSPANFEGVHSLTTRTMQYLTSLADYSNVLNEIFLDINHPPSKSPLSEDIYATETATEFSVWMARLIVVLVCKIEGKSKQWKNASLCYLFVANNLQHLMEKVRASKLQYVLGDDWELKHIAKVKQLMEDYESSVSKHTGSDEEVGLDHR